jgi:hypothetical protein
LSSSFFLISQLLPQLPIQLPIQLTEQLPIQLPIQLTEQLLIQLHIQLLSQLLTGVIVFVNGYIKHLTAFSTAPTTD